MNNEISLRAYLAMQALHGMLAGDQRPTAGTKASDFAASAVRFADALIEALGPDALPQVEPPRCVHGRVVEEPCEHCDKPVQILNCEHGTPLNRDCHLCRAVAAALAPRPGAPAS